MDLSGIDDLLLPVTQIVTRIIRFFSKFPGLLLRTMDDMNQLVSSTGSLVTYLFYRIVLIVYSSVHDWVCRAPRPDDDDSKAVQYMRILCRNKSIELDLSREYDFALCHQRYASVDDILHDDHWAIYAFSAAHVYFVRLPHPFVYYDIERAPFQFWPLHQEALQVARMHVKKFARLGTDKVPDRCADIIWYGNSPRCGTTLISQLLHVEGASYVFGEPDAFGPLAALFEKEVWPEALMDDVLYATLRLFIHHVPQNHKCIIKLRSYCNVLNTNLSRVAPSVTQMFVYRRDVHAMVSSTERVVSSIMVLPLPFLMWMQKTPFVQWYMGSASYELNSINLIEPQKDIEIGWLAGASPYVRFLQDKRLYSIVTTYEDVIQNPVEELTRVFRLCGLPVDKVHASIDKWMGNDSQANTCISRERIGNIKSTQLSSVDRSRAIDCARRYGLPDDFFMGYYITESNRLPCDDEHDKPN